LSPTLGADRSDHVQRRIGGSQRATEKPCCASVPAVPGA